MSPPADLVVANARVVDPRRRQSAQGEPVEPSAHGEPVEPWLAADAIAIADGCIRAVGPWAELSGQVGPHTEVLDAGGGAAMPGLHDAHLHLLSYARARAHLDCGGIDSIPALQAALVARAAALTPLAWVRAIRYDDSRLRERRHPDRWDLDAAVPDRPVRLQHRSLHLEVLNSPALHLTGLLEVHRPEIERDPATGAPTGRVYQAGEVLRGRVPGASEVELAADVAAATTQLLAWGITNVQDASVTNGGEEWALFQRLAAGGALRVRAFVMAGSAHWREMTGEDFTFSPTLPRRGGGNMVFPGPVKFMLDERTTDPGEVRGRVAEVWRAGRAVALHAVSEAEVAIACDVLRGAPPGLGPGPNRIEHGAVLPDALLAEVQATGAMVIGQPALVYERGDVYRAEFAPPQHGWLHRARSLLAAGIPYAIGSDAPVTNPSPGLALGTAQRRQTRGGAILGPDEALDPSAALAACTLGPAAAVGAADWLGHLGPGALADLAIMDPAALAEPDTISWDRAVRYTLMEGLVVWAR